MPRPASQPRSQLGRAGPSVLVRPGERGPSGRRAAAHHAASANRLLTICTIAPSCGGDTVVQNGDTTGGTRMASTEQAVDGKARSRSWPSATCGCTSPGCRAYDDEPRCRSSSEATGCYVWDEHGKRYLDGLSALFCVNIGHGRADIVQAGADQAKELGFFTNWSYAHPPAIELAARIASLAPGDLNRVFFTSGGSRGGRVGLQARAPVPQADRQAEQDQADRARDRLPRDQPRRAVGHRHHQPAHAVRAAHPGRPPRAQHQHLPDAPGRDRGATSPSRSPRRSSSRARTRWRR